jgi:predicted CoA-binding protein
MKIADAANGFLAHRRVAVTGVSHAATDHGANVVYKRFRERGYEVFAVNPNADEVEGDTAYPSLAAIPGGVEAVVLGTAPAHTLDTIRECIELGIAWVWFHHGPGPGSSNPEAAALGRDAGLTVIEGGCPCMFGETADMGHKLMRPFLKLSGTVPRTV